MNNKNHRALCDAVSGIDDDLIVEAAEPKVLPFTKRILRLTAIAAVLAILMTALLWPSEENYITGPGALKVYAHGVDEFGNATIESEILEEGVEFTQNIRYDPQINFVQHFPISFNVDQDLYSGMQITLEINTDAGIFYKNEPYDLSLDNKSYAEQLLATHYGQHFTLDIDKKIYWTPWGFDYDYLKAEVNNGNHDLASTLKSNNFSKNPSFIDVIIRANDLIIGYSVIEIQRTMVTEYAAEEYCFEVVKIVSFPQVDGCWQNVTLKYVQEQINQIHKEREAS